MRKGLILYCHTSYGKMLEKGHKYEVLNYGLEYSNISLDSYIIEIVDLTNSKKMDIRYPNYYLKTLSEMRKDKIKASL